MAEDLEAAGWEVRGLVVAGLVEVRGAEGAAGSEPTGECVAEARLASLGCEGPAVSSAVVGLEGLVVEVTG